MMNNSSSTPVAVDIGKVVTYSIYTCLGAVEILVNLSVTFTVVLNRKLRQKPENSLVGGYAGADLVWGCSCFNSGVRRLFIVFNPTQPLTSAFGCMKEFFNTTSILGAQLVALMMLTISIDRLICICSLSVYITLGSQYRYLLLAVPYSIALGSTIVAWILSVTMMPATANLDPLCSTNSAVPVPFYLYHSLVLVGASVGSVLLYGIVLAVFVLRKHTTHQQHKSLQARSAKRQAKITKLFGMLQASSLLLYALPSAVMTYFVYVPNGGNTVNLITTIGVLRSAYSVVGTAIYLSRPSEIRDQLLHKLGFLGCGGTPVQAVGSINGGLSVLLSSMTPAAVAKKKAAKTVAQAPAKEQRAEEVHYSQSPGCIVTPRDADVRATPQVS